ncbi:E3 ubiquitin protein ligase DRIP2 isoform X2 [Momordica charantia]|uniref:E3 ubiquitin protein ligase DRIP2 isoform X2 n=1 Tax=Momordica charantia TaxID=3673 RepID=A0A6J1CXD2_MOMCH|nr:E3 ubiquitin protein ligase DRIP2 isoform X2 [Momordica charantia]
MQGSSTWVRIWDFWAMANQVVKVKREAIAACITCPLCHKLLKEATTVSECLHTFCRKCIYDKISDEELESCPVCNIDLGCVPLEKLRPDHNLEDLRSRIFPSKRRKVRTPEVAPVILPPVRRKERSLSSLVVNSPRVSSHATTTGKRTAAAAVRIAAILRTPKVPNEKRVKKEDDSAEERSESSSSLETSDKFNQNKRLDSSPTKSTMSLRKKEVENGVDSLKGNVDIWKPLNYLVEVANRSKCFKSNSEGFEAKVEPADIDGSEAQASKSRNRESKRKKKRENGKTRTDLVSPETERPKKSRRVRQKREPLFGDCSITPQVVLDATSARHERRAGPIWLSLIASEQEGDAPLPQIPARYLRIKDGNLPVSFVQKYLMRKLDLSSESEVEVKCMGHPVVPTLDLHSLVDMWLQTASTSEKIPASIGSSAEDFIMVLYYARKIPLS